MREWQGEEEPLGEASVCDLRVAGEWVMVVPERRLFQAEGMDCVKTLRQETYKCSSKSKFLDTPVAF